MQVGLYAQVTFCMPFHILVLHNIITYDLSLTVTSIYCLKSIFDTRNSINYMSITPGLLRTLIKNRYLLSQLPVLVYISQKLKKIIAPPSNKLNYIFLLVYVVYNIKYEKRKVSLLLKTKKKV